jgi:hypothetical protein
VPRHFEQRGERFAVGAVVVDDQDRGHAG